MRLPRDFRETGRAALDAIAAPGRPASAEAIPDLETLAQLLFFSAGVVRSKRARAGENVFSRRGLHRRALRNRTLRRLHRSPGRTNARCKNSPASRLASTISASPSSACANCARETSGRRLVEATGGDPSIAHAPVTIICTGTYWRNAWKYRSRTYRHFGWDNGTILANLVAISEASNLPARIVTGFVDSQINELLSLDTKREVAFSLVPIGHKQATPPSPPQISPLELPIVPYSKEEVDYPAMRKMHEASSLDSAAEVAAMRGKTPSQRRSPAQRDELRRCILSTTPFRPTPSRK